ncbi:fatty acid alpha-hydroxylase [Allomyces javanicus]|nr:fatty acid alpha-hydroxylase [Allomyces javanicus]
MTKLRVISRRELAKHASEDSLWVAYKGKVYDVTEFAPDHPGEPEFVLQWGGKDVTKIMADAHSHEHSDAAYDILADWVIGELEPSAEGDDADADAGRAIKPEDVDLNQDPGNLAALDAQLVDDLARQKKDLLDLSKPLVWQMLTSNFSKDFYLTQVHIPHHLPEPAYLFGNPILETLTRTPWYVVPIVWLPVVAYLAYEASKVYAPDMIASLFVAGLIMWSFFEYTFHRFLFHIELLLPDHPFALTFHFLCHGIHHHLPMDRMRLVLPPIFFGIIVQPPWFAFRAFLDFPTCAGLFAGGVAGYVIYDLTHYYLHHARVYTAYLRDLKKYHLAHHYKEYNAGYGITSKAWDYVFGTVLDYSSKPKKA